MVPYRTSREKSRPKGFLIMLGSNQPAQNVVIFYKAIYHSLHRENKKVLIRLHRCACSLQVCP